MHQSPPCIVIEMNSTSSQTSKTKIIHNWSVEKPTTGGLPESYRMPRVIIINIQHQKILKYRQYHLKISLPLWKIEPWALNLLPGALTRSTTELLTIMGMKIRKYILQIQFYFTVSHNNEMQVVLYEHITSFVEHRTLGTQSIAWCPNQRKLGKNPFPLRFHDDEASPLLFHSVQLQVTQQMLYW